MDEYHNDSWARVNADIPVPDDPDFDWVFRSLGKTGGVIVLAAAGVLLPIAFWLAETYLHLERAPFEIRVSIIVICWMMLMLVVLSPLIVVIKLPAIGRLVLGPELYRKRWIALQMFAWFDAVTHAAIGVAFWMGAPNFKGLDEAIGMHWLSALLGLAGSHIGAMGFMPPAFFDSHELGQAVKRFLGAETTDGVPARCLLGSLALLGMSAAMSYVVITTFGK